MIKADFPLENNPKEAFGLSKPSSFCIPPVALIELGAVMREGANKYGVFNWRGSETKASVYYDGMMRHLLAWRDGETADLESGLHPLAHVMANCAILIDAEKQDTLFDDRGLSGNARRVIEELTKQLLKG